MQKKSPKFIDLIVLWLYNNLVLYNKQGLRFAGYYLGGYMGKKKSMALLIVLSIVLALFTAMTFVNFHIPFVKEGTREFNSFLSIADLDVDLEEGRAYTLTLNEDSEEVEDIEEVRTTLSERLNGLGYSNYKLTCTQETADSEYEIRIFVKEKTNSSETDSDIATVAAYGEVVFANADNTTIVTGKEAIKDAVAVETTDGEVGYTMVNIEFTDYGYQTILDAITAFEEAQVAAGTSEQFTLKIVLGDDFENALLNSTISSADFSAYNGIISVTVGDETMDANAKMASAERLALQIKTGGLAYKYDVSSSAIVSALYGANVKIAILIAVLAVIVIVMVLMGVFFKGIGLAMDIALLAQVDLQIFLLWAIPNVTVSIGSVIGFVLAFLLSSSVMALCAYKIKKGFAEGKTVKAAVKNAYGKSLLTALDVHVVTGGLALALVFGAVKAVKGFAVTFGLGVVVSMLVSLALAHLLVSIIVGISGGKENFLGVKREG